MAQRELRLFIVVRRLQYLEGAPFLARILREKWGFLTRSLSFPSGGICCPFSFVIPTIGRNLLSSPAREGQPLEGALTAKGFHDRPEASLLTKLSAPKN